MRSDDEQVGIIRREGAHGAHHSFMTMLTHLELAMPNAIAGDIAYGKLKRRIRERWSILYSNGTDQIVPRDFLASIASFQALCASL